MSRAVADTLLVVAPFVLTAALLFVVLVWRPAFLRRGTDRYGARVRVAALVLLAVLALLPLAGWLR